MKRWSINSIREKRRDKKERDGQKENMGAAEKRMTQCDLMELDGPGPSYALVVASVKAGWGAAIYHQETLPWG